jgi:maltose/moltooligosaccharide transporter
MWIYWTPATARQVFGGNPADEAAWNKVIETAGAWTGICFATYNLVCFVFSFALLFIARYVSAKTIHVVCLLIGAAGLISARFVSDQYVLLGSMAAVGIAWASILSMPYAMLSSAIPADRMGFYMGVFNFFIVIPQVLVALAMGPLIGSAFGGDSMMAILTGGICMIVASLATLRVDYQGGKVGLPAGTGH